MTVTTAFVEFRLNPLNWGASGGGPLGQWEALAVAVGDASAGGVVMSHQFATGYLWSLEAWVLSQTIAAGVGEFQVAWRPQIIPDAQAWVLQASAETNIGVRSVVVRDSALRLPVGGFATARAVAPVTVDLTAENNAIGAIYRGNIWGYYWSRTAVQAPGGLVRPP